MPLSRPSQARAPGKVILLGEHAVVYGQPAVALPLDRGVSVHAEPASSLRLKTLPASGAPAVAAALARLGEALGNPRVEVSIDSSIPLSAGLGSSAAVAVALVRALAASAGVELSEERVLELAGGMEQQFHGRASGIDHTTCALAVPLRFQLVAERPQVRRLQVPRFGYVVALSGPRSGTKERVAALRAAWEADRPRYDAIFAEVGALVDAGVAALEQGHWPELGRLMRENQRILASLGLSTEAIDSLCAKLEDRGALGAKLTGAGGGGAVVALHPEPERLARELERAGTWSFGATWEGNR